MKIYLAGRFDDQAQLRLVRDMLVGLGHTVTSRWLSEDAADWTGEFETHGHELAERDLEDIDEAEVLLLDTTGENKTNGRLVEFGYAIGRGMAVGVVGPKRNVFHYLEWIPNTASWDDVWKTSWLDGFSKT